MNLLFTGTVVPIVNDPFPEYEEALAMAIKRATT